MLRIEIDQILATKATRRTSLEGALILAATFATACSSGVPTVSKTPESARIPGTEDGSNRLKIAVESLNPSPIKDLLVQRVLRYYQNPRPPFVELAGVKIPIFDSGVEITTIDRIGVGGVFSPRKSKKAPFEVLYPTKSTFTLISLIDLFADSEANSYPKIAKLSDGTRYISVNFVPQTPTYEGVYPKISLQKPNPKLVKPKDEEFYKVNEETVLIKEACGNLLYEILIEETIIKMKQNNFPTHIEVKKQGGSIAQAEIINQAIVLATERRGRLLALLDLASYLVGHSAIKGTRMAEDKFQAPYVKEVLGPTQGMDLGNTPESILATSFRWVLENPTALKLPHVGDISILP